jgi:hypothetical protein
MAKMLRPETEVLSESALVPVGKLIQPPPNIFTHRLKKTAPFYFYEADATAGLDGNLNQDSKVSLLSYNNGKYCRVVDERGLYVEIEYACLAPLGED